MKKLIFSLAMASAVLMTTVTTSCKKDNAKPVDNSTKVDPAKLATAQKEYDDAKAELEVANNLVVVTEVKEIVSKAQVGTAASADYKAQVGTPASADYKAQVGTPASYDYSPQVGTPASANYVAPVSQVGNVGDNKSLFKFYSTVIL